MGTQTCPEPAVPMGRLSVALWLSYQSADRFIADCPGVGEWHSSPAGRGLRVAGGVLLVGGGEGLPSPHGRDFPGHSRPAVVPASAAVTHIPLPRRSLPSPAFSLLAALGCRPVSRKGLLLAGAPRGRPAWLPP